MQHPAIDSAVSQTPSPQPPKSLARALLWPLLLPLQLLLLQLLGARAEVVVLSGTAPLGLRSLVGLVYVMAWFSCIVVLPPWLAGVLLGRALRARGGRREGG